MYVTLPEFEKLSVEVQIRTIEQHDWATFVETIDLLYDTKIKEGINTTTEEQYSDFCMMHKILSKQDTYRNPREEIELINTIVKYDILGKLDEVIVSNIATVRHQWATMMSEFSCPQYFYIGTTTDNTPSISAYTSYSAAEQYYYDSFEKNSNKNQVIVSLINPSYDTICMAYSNYMLVCHKFTHRIHDLFTKVIKDNVSNDIAEKVTIYYSEIGLRLTKRIDIEIKELLQSSGRYNNEIMQEWVQDVRQNLEQYRADFANISNTSIKMMLLKNSNRLSRIIKGVIYDLVSTISPNYIINRIIEINKKNDRVENI